LNNPHLGSRLSEESLKSLRAEAAEAADVQIVVSDGLSAEAVHANVGDLLPVLMDGLAARRLQSAAPLLVRYGRVKVAEQIAEALRVPLVVLLIGERPGGDALSSRSLSAYFVYQLLDAEARQAAAQFSGHPDIRFEYMVISNIREGGLPPVEAGSLIVETIGRILNYRAAGNRLESLGRLPCAT
jgi:ethanolamine ammonia-lyase large subunit